MTAFAITVPYLRTSPNHIPRRDLVVAASDSIEIEVTVVERDSPDALALDLTGGMGGPALRMVIWPECGWPMSWDYGMQAITTTQSALWSGVGTISATTDGTFDLTVPVASAAHWPARCNYTLYLDTNGGLSSQQIVQGIINFAPAFGAPTTTAEVITTDALDPITTD